MEIKKGAVMHPFLLSGEKKFGVRPKALMKVDELLLWPRTFLTVIASDFCAAEVVHGGTVNEPKDGI